MIYVFGGYILELDAVLKLLQISAEVMELRK